MAVSEKVPTMWCHTFILTKAPRKETGSNWENEMKFKIVFAGTRMPLLITRTTIELALEYCSDDLNTHLLRRNYVRTKLPSYPSLGNYLFLELLLGILRNLHFLLQRKKIDSAIQWFSFLYVVYSADYANMTSAFSVSARKTQSLWNAVHQDIPSNSVIVKNLSPATSEDTIMIHFQRKRNGGGEVERVRLLSEGVAVVTFEKSEGW